MSETSEHRPTLHSPSRVIYLPGEQGLQADEKVWTLTESTTFSFDYKHLRRVQTIRVVRNDKMVEFTRDLGPAADWDTAPFAVVSLFADSVGQAMESADYLRGEGPAELLQVMQEHLHEYNVIDDAIQRATEMQSYMRANPRTIRNLQIQTNKQKSVRSAKAFAVGL